MQSTAKDDLNVISFAGIWLKKITDLTLDITWCKEQIIKLTTNHPEGDGHV